MINIKVTPKNSSSDLIIPTFKSNSSHDYYFLTNTEEILLCYSVLIIFILLMLEKNS